jgi:hypothetical protein
VNTGGLTASDTVNLTACEQGCSCDVDGNGTVGIGDLQLLINQVLGLAPATCDINGDGHVGIADIQIVINAILGMGCNP